MHALRWLGNRLGRKLKALLPLGIASIVLICVLWLVMLFVRPRLPAEWQRVLSQLGTADWEDARDDLRVLLDQANVAIEWAFMGFQVLQVVVAPIPGQLAGLVGGWLFGFWKGLFLTMIGLAVGSFLAIGLGRLLGKHVIRKFVPERLIAQFDSLVGDDGLWAFFLIFLLPVFPDDAACFLAGLTSLRLWKLWLVCLAGRLPGMAVLAYVGSSAGEGQAAATVVFIIAMCLSVALWLFSEELEAWFLRTFRRPGVVAVETPVPAPVSPAPSAPEPKKDL